MAALAPVDYDPFAAKPVTLVPVDHDPFAAAPSALPAPPPGEVIHTSANNPMGDMVAQPDGTLKEAHPFNVLPFSLDQTGRPQFDSNAGVLGAIKSAVSLPDDVYSGKIDPNSNEGIARAVNMAAMISPSSAAGVPKAREPV